MGSSHDRQRRLRGRLRAVFVAVDTRIDRRALTPLALLTARTAQSTEATIGGTPGAVSRIDSLRPYVIPPRSTPVHIALIATTRSAAVVSLVGGVFGSFQESFDGGEQGFHVVVDGGFDHGVRGVEVAVR